MPLYPDAGQTGVFEWLEKAYEERDHWMYLLKTHRPLGILRDDPRFDDLLRRMNLPPD